MKWMDDKAADEAWDEFRDALRGGMNRLGWGEQLVLEAPTRLSGVVPRVAIKAGDFTECWATYLEDGVPVWPVFLPVDDDSRPDDLPDAIVRVFRELVDVAHPRALRAWPSSSGAATFAEELGVELAWAIREEARFVRDGAASGKFASGRPDDLRDFVCRVIAQVLICDSSVWLGDLERTGELTYRVTRWGPEVYFYFHPWGTSVRIWSKVVRNVRKTRFVGREVGRLNRESQWAKWSVVDRDVIASMNLPARPLSAENLLEALEGFNWDLHVDRVKLARRLGGKTAVGMAV